ncbi:MAG: hypothetical protein H0T73_19020, partial [Ardenticatenales bacterium]|nr:hypothetical protein [Ardenticatenales bacterium]
MSKPFIKQATLYDNKLHYQRPFFSSMLRWTIALITVVALLDIVAFVRMPT